MSYVNRQLQVSLHILCTHVESAQLTMPVQSERSMKWQAQVNTTHEQRVEHGSRRWDVVTKIEGIIRKFLPKQYAETSGGQVLDVAWIFENTLHRLASSLETYCQENFLEQRIKALARAYALRIVARNSELEKYRSTLMRPRPRPLIRAAGAA
mmetsp:Transcript_27571/g.42758  ORF Transcript_27571/g.42758 Transcript_27571/m.42758 type:complete len:153 (+) Transcript_27571:126-584(+)|eukprot:CAMPEP_0196813396 /NCGR_PEP_ID=MMETSP1362-20130617/36459_1 /TAXON_ID=163516 /ORGANISM="Leptocylindrus danicus, Strain CCMP1856" /LENGTH=152 /DNA_ID=CAMNT_0042189615 /DNA_START=113 /DNA_END=571 /DNA_ORIENTATION=+